MKMKYLILSLLFFFSISCANSDKKETIEQKQNIETEEGVVPTVSNKVKVDDTILIYKVSLGVLPDLTYKGIGVKAAKVHENRPGDNGGLKDGDIVIKIDNNPVKDLVGYTRLLSRHKKGDSVIMTIKRGNKTLKANITFD